jgi:hypothetical protein
MMILPDGGNDEEPADDCFVFLLGDVECADADSVLNRKDWLYNRVPRKI